MEKQTGSRSFGAFNGVFVPTFLSIIGVILFLRLGYIVGEAGILGTIAIILLAISVTITTGLALSSITTNINIGGGGAYSIISKTLGLEIGGSIGIPLFFAQSLSVALYIFGFGEVWHFLFPLHNLTYVLVIVTLVLILLILISTRIAVRAQLFIFVLVFSSLIAVFLGTYWYAGASLVPLIGETKHMPFWGLFALFFPAVTGLMAGIGMSGELTNPKKQIPKGILTALGITTAIYITMVFFLANSATPAQLIGDSLIIAKLSILGPVVLLGILAATFSSALTTFVAAPRVLQALGENSLIPGGKFMSKKTSRGEPRNAIFITAALILFALFIGNLNSIAQVLTVNYLITYATINLSVLIEQTLGLVAFRPTFRVPRLVTLYGVLSSIAIIFLISVIGGFAAIFSIFLLYIYLTKRKLNQDEGDVRSGLFRAISRWAAKRAMSLPESSKHIWKPNVFVPVITTSTLSGNFPLIKSIVYPSGTMTVLGIKLTENLKKNPEEKNLTKNQIEDELNQLPNLVKKFGETNIFTSFSTVEAKDYTEALTITMGVLKSQVFPPNVLFLPFKPARIPIYSLRKIVNSAKKREIGLAIFDRHTEIGLGSEKDVHVWISPSELDKDFYAERFFDLALLIAYKVQTNWKGKIVIRMCVGKERHNEAKRYLQKIVYESRFPQNTEIKIEPTAFMKAVTDAEEGDLHIIPFRPDNLEKALKIAEIDNKSFLFVMDSTTEDVLA